MLPKIILVSFFMLFGYLTRAQVQSFDVVADNLKSYHLQHNRSTLFIHFDKNVYTNNDQVWFTAYLLKAAVKSDQFHTLYLSLVNAADSTILLQEKFLIEEGMAFGSFTLPDSLQSGHYNFVANTNIKLNNDFDGVFMQPIIINSTTINPLVPKVSVFKSYDEKTKKGTALLKVLSSDNRFVEQAEVSYKIGRGNNILHAGKAKSNVIGEIMIDYNADQINEENNLLQATIRKGKSIRNLTFNLPVRNAKKYKINFYPESGNLIDQLYCRLGFEIKDENGNAIHGRAVLYDNDKVIDTISTNSVGMGSFMLQPNKNKRLYVKIPGIDSAKRFDLPSILPDGLVLRARNSVVDNDLRVQLESNKASSIHVVLHDFSTIYLHSAFELKAFSIQNIRFKLDSVPIGLYALTILNEAYQPIAERIFFAHYDQINKIQIGTDKEEYQTRDRIELSLNALGRNNKPLLGLVSVSCVQANRLAQYNNQNITDFYFFQRHLPDLPQHPLGVKYQDPEYLNLVLLIKGWRKYKWQGEKLATTKFNQSSMELRGTVKKDNGRLKTPMVLNTIGGTKINVLVTDSAGHFIIPSANLLSTEQGRVWLSLSDKKSYKYDVELNDPLFEIKKYLTNIGYKPLANGVVMLEDNISNLTASSGIKLKDVVIKSKKDDRLNFAVRGANKCGDYVCRSNILNCGNHIGDSENRPPEQGKTYKQAAGSGSITYSGCTDNEDKPNFKILKGIRLAKDFYQPDILNMNEPINFVTIYWNYQVAIKASDHTKVVFNTGDISGRFKIIVQGVTSEGVAYGEKEITIKSK
ncbi:hypothetical protein OQZ29_16040 [Pedobacter agri]|uniref:Macroglobulin domain-containing protein n=1 Tax=Pedobacter agri TaxID=454586 RepID=A0A9X3DFM2_9SPHI|nr:hypothetical protein [Pedobacter agri]MCX3266270.1 hypothetical protein [Pedobacter agri]